MVDGIRCVGCFAPAKNPNQILKERAEQRRIIREEMRYNDLSNKAKNGDLTANEKTELALMKFNRTVEKIAENPPVVYVA